MTAHRKRRHTAHAITHKDESTETDWIPLAALGGLVVGFFTLFLGAEVTLSTRPHPVHWLAAAGGGAFFYLAGLLYARRTTGHPRRKV